METHEINTLSFNHPLQPISQSTTGIDQPDFRILEKSPSRDAIFGHYRPVQLDGFFHFE